MNGTYDELGGADGVRTAVAILYRRIADDEMLAPWFAGVDLERLQAHQRAFLAAAFADQPVYGGRELSEAHAGLDITGEAFDRVVATLVTALDDLGVSTHAIAAVAERLGATRTQVVSA